MGLNELGYCETQLNLWQKKLADGRTIVHDFRGGKRKTYGYNNDGSCEIRNTLDYKIIKLLETLNKCSK
jgi:hypothetical protein